MEHVVRSCSRILGHVREYTYYPAAGIAVGIKRWALVRGMFSVNSTKPTKNDCRMESLLTLYMFVPLDRNKLFAV